MKPYFSIVMPSFLGDYANAASHRQEKFKRAVNSVLGQSFMSWELLIVADGCEKTQDIYRTDYSRSCRIKCIPIPKEPLWSTAVRNWGIQHADGEYVVYLDTDDYWGPGHLQKIRLGLAEAKSPMWAFFNDLYWSPDKELFLERICDPRQKFHYGTSNFAHRVDAGIMWPANSTYAHDALFGQDLRTKAEGVRIPAGEYYVCHDPGKFDI